MGLAAGMRLALVCDWYAPRVGGIETHLSGLGARLAQRGWQPHAITATPGPISSHGDPVQIHRLRARRLPVAGVVFQPNVVDEIAGLLLREEIQLVHAHVSIVSPTAIAAALAAQRLALPTVVTFHSFVPGTPLWAFIAGRLLGANHWRANMTAVSSRVASEVSAFSRAHEFSILPNAIDTRFWSPGPERDRSGRLTLVYAGRLHPKKRPLAVIAAAVEIARRAPALDFVIRICGTGPLEATMRRRVAAAGLQDKVEFLSWQSPASLRDLLRSADIFLSPATRESFGLAALEARCVGVPVIAMRRSAVPDFITDGDTGLLPDSIRDFNEAVVTLALNSERRTALAERCRQSAPNLDWDNSMAHHETLYGRAMARGA